MAQYRIQNDIIGLDWVIFKKDGIPVDFNDPNIIQESIVLELRHRQVKDVIISQPFIFVDNNVIKIDFLADEQTITGDYDLYLQYKVNEGDVLRTYTIDKAFAFELVGSSSEIKIPTDRVIYEGILEQLRGLSAYEIALKNGFVGTEKEWLTSLAVSTDTLYIADRPKLVFKDSVKTINNESILGVGNIDIIGGIQVESDPIYSADKPFIALKSDLSNYSEINHTHNEYLTVHQDISYLATKAEIPTNTSQLINDSGYLTVHQDLSHLALKIEIPTNVSQLINDFGYLTQHQDISNKQDLLISGSNIKTINNQSILGTGNIVIEGGTGGIENETDPIYLADKPSIALKSELPDISTKQDVLVSGINIKTVNNQSLLGLGNIEITGGIDSETDPIYTSEKSTLALKTDLNAYAKKTEIPVIPAETDPVWTAEKINYALKTEIPTVPTNVSEFINDSGYLTQHQSLTDYAKKTDIPDITSLAYKSEIPSNTSELINDSGYITDYTETDPVYQIEKPTLALKADLNAYALKTDILSETQTTLDSLSLLGNVLTIKYIGENSVVQSKSIDLSSLILTDTKVSNATYNASTNILTITMSDSVIYDINLSEFSIINSTDVNGITTLEQEGVVKLTVSKVGQTGEYSDLKNKPVIDSELSSISNNAVQNKVINTALNSKVDNSRVLTDVPLNAKFTDTVYTHPETHPASIILQNESNRFVSDAEKLAWNDKVDNSRVLTDVPANAKFTDTIYTHPTSHPFSMITGAPTSLPANGGDSATVNGKTVEENVPAGAKFTDTVYTHPAGTNPHGTTKADVGLGSVDNTSDANKPVSTAQQTALNAKMDSNKFQVVASLPASPVSGTFYFVKE